MTSSKDRESIATYFTELDRTHWMRVEDALVGFVGEKGAKTPLLLSMEDWVAYKTQTEGAEAEDPETVEAFERRVADEWLVANDTVHNVLAVSMRNCASARAILHKHRADRPIDEDAEVLEALQTQIYADGRSAWLELKETALGGQGVDSAEGYLAELYRLVDDSTSVDDLLVTHASLVQQIVEVPDLTLDMVFKMHLLRCIKRYPECSVVEQLCATDPDKTHADTVRELRGRLNRLKASGDESTAFAADSIECWSCGQEGHTMRTCRVKSGRRQKGSGGKGGGRSKGSSGKGYRAVESTKESKWGEGQSKGAKLRKKAREAEAKLAEAEARGSGSNNSQGSQGGDYGFGFA